KSGKKQDIVNIYKSIGIPVNEKSTSSDWVSVSQTHSSVNIQNANLKASIVPDVIGMGLRDALFLLGNCGLQVKPIGKGVIKSQSIPAGNRAVNGQTIYILLS
ncbi:MAG: peptidoglycan glycosyltransferase, partial [Bacteroidetes bacterium CG_4_10_14_3_um_filter_31_20]